MFINKSKLFQTGLAFAVVLSSGMISNTYAQEDGAFAIEEITVTARKKEESIFETPLAITAVDAAEIQSAGFKNILDVQKTAPGLFIESMNNENGRVVVMPRFRGVTFDATSPLQRTSSVFVDGLIVTSGLHSLPITQVERVEIIKGPQSALFGRNTYSGAINIVTAKPGDEFKGSIEYDYANKSGASATGFFEGPIGEMVGARFNWSYTDKDGHYMNDNALLQAPQRLGDEQTLAMGALIDINPSDSLNITLRASKYEDLDGPGAYAVAGGLDEHNFCAAPTSNVTGWTCFTENGLESVYKGNLQIPSSLGASTSSYNWNRAMGHITDDDGNWSGYYPIGDNSFNDLKFNGYGLVRDGERASVTISYDISDSMNLNVAYGTNDDDYLLFHDFDADAGFGFHTAAARVTEDETFEVRLSGSNDQFDWSIGATQVDLMTKTHGGFFDGRSPYFSYWFADIYNPDGASTTLTADTFGIYGSIDYRLTDSMTLIAEVRRQEDEVGNNKINASAGKALSPSTFKSTLPRLVLKNDLSDNSMIYVSYSEGTLPGGFNPEVAAKLNTAEQIATFTADVPGIGETYGEEELTNMEFGWKKTSDDGRFAMTLAMFSMERSDQVYSGFGVIPADLNCDPTGNVPTCTVAFSGNGTSSDIEGLEFDFTYAYSENTTFQGGLGYTRAKIASFPAGADCGDYDDVFGNSNCVGQIAARYPEWQGSLVVKNERETSMGEVYMRAELYYTGSYYDEVTNMSVIPNAREINLRAGVRMDNGISIEAYVANLTDEDAPLGGNNIADTSNFVRTNTSSYNFAVESTHIHLRDKREYGLRLTYNF
ncbi:MAG TPA: TonB-dependent receptor [Gammaproteobacteria bacterium]|jgi:iron complex outermembrane receptor protein|nr:TonB-dependent receptor [Gammaproteobacteria bacterium]